MSKKDNISSFQIAHSKIWADGEKYFSLFEKHIPILEAGQKVLVYDISNLDFICKLMSLNKDAEFWIYGNQEVNEALRALGFSFHEVAEDLESKTYNIPDMKFDCIIMNPPYQRNLHLKILAEAITHLKDEKSTCVNLSPDNWITNPYKLFESDKCRCNARKNIAPYICYHESFSANQFNELFGTSNWFGVGIIKVGKIKTNFDVNKFNSNNALVIKLLTKIITLPSLRSKFSRRTSSQFFVPVRRTSHGYLNYCEFDDNIVKSKDGIQFSSNNEVINFKNSIINTWFYKFLEKSDWLGSQNSAEVPYMEDYTEPWTDERFYKFFNITPEEQKIIEDTMKKYK